jgi:non-ribosomal peptide synthetase component F
VVCVVCVGVCFFFSVSFCHSECQRAVSYYVVPPNRKLSNMNEILSVGKGMIDVQLLVLNQRPSGYYMAGVGELGEIYVRSPHLALGYLGLIQLTAERFIVNPFTKHPADRLYRTGDLGHYLPNGEVCVAGRADHQVCLCACFFFCSVLLLCSVFFFFFFALLLSGDLFVFVDV